MSIVDFLAGRKVLEKAKSKFNGELVVVKDISWGTHILAGGLTQSGGVTAKFWRSTVGKVNSLMYDPPKTALILGLGGGCLANILLDKWPSVEVTGVDIDPVIVSLGQKHLGLDKSRTNIVIEDAELFVDQKLKDSAKYDLILVDMYQGDTVPSKFTSSQFIQQVKQLMNERGIIVFNRLYYGEKRPLAVKFLSNLEKIFTKVQPFYPEANVMYICRSN